MVLFFLPFSIRSFIGSLTLFNCNVYAGYYSYKSIMKKNVEDTTRWLMYWCLMAIFLSLENLFGTIVSYILPLYPEIKMISLLILVISNYAPIYVLHYYIVPKLELMNIPYYVNQVVNLILYYLLIILSYIFNMLIKKSAQLNKQNVNYLNNLINQIEEISFELKSIKKDTLEQIDFEQQ
ncbi:hypothetical protein ABK040_010517 [Willaertia magna]